MIGFISNYSYYARHYPFLSQANFMAKLHDLYTPFSVKNLNLKNRVVMPPMCQYQATDGLVNDWHLVHYASRAVGGVGLIIVEMTNVMPNGRITPNCLGLWNDQQRDELKKIVDVVHARGRKLPFKLPMQGVKRSAVMMWFQHLQSVMTVPMKATTAHGIISNRVNSARLKSKKWYKPFRMRETCRGCRLRCN